MSLLVVFVCVVCNFNANCKDYYFLSFFFVSTFLSLASIQILMSLLLNVSTHNSSQCLCLGLQHSAACLYSGKYLLLFISKGQFVNKPKHYNHLLEIGKDDYFIVYVYRLLQYILGTYLGLFQMAPKVFVCLFVFVFSTEFSYLCIPLINYCTMIYKKHF